jgi:hypothetical protein
MRRPHRVRALVVPALVGATTLGLGSACPDRSESTSDDATAADDGDADTGELPDCMIADEDDCAAVDGCTWSTQVEYCVVDCARLEDPQTCETADFCEWTGEACVHHAI